MITPPTYCIDASSLIRGHVEVYPLGSFPSLWKEMEQLIAGGRLCAPDEICKEVIKRTNTAAHWIKTQSGLCVPTSSAHFVETQRIVGQFTNLVKTARGKSGGDPWLIAVAKLHGHIIVTEERKQNDMNNPRIPDVAEALGIECVSLKQLIEKEQWVF